MSNDLISRSALLESVNYYYTHTPNDSPEHYAYGVALKEIREHPTAFDKEKVIEKLKCECDNRLKNWEENLFWNENRKEEGVIKGLSMAITIVEKGGIE